MPLSFLPSPAGSGNAGQVTDIIVMQIKMARRNTNVGYALAYQQRTRLSNFDHMQNTDPTFRFRDAIASHSPTFRPVVLINSSSTVRL